MKEGIKNEPIAAKQYNTDSPSTCNIYPCGIVIHPTACWLAASPDKEVYLPDRTPPFGLLEIKCPCVTSVLECKYLVRQVDGSLSLKTNHEYHLQIQMQLAVCGLHWCDFYVWCNNDYHLETINFDPEFWQATKDKVDGYFFNYFIKQQTGLLAIPEKSNAKTPEGHLAEVN